MKNKTKTPAYIKPTMPHYDFNIPFRFWPNEDRQKAIIGNGFLAAPWFFAAEINIDKCLGFRLDEYGTIGFKIVKYKNQKGSYKSHYFHPLFDTKSQLEFPLSDLPDNYTPNFTIVNKHYFSIGWAWPVTKTKDKPVPREYGIFIVRLNWELLMNASRNHYGLTTFSIVPYYHEKETKGEQFQRRKKVNGIYVDENDSFMPQYICLQRNFKFMGDDTLKAAKAVRW